MSVRVDQPSVRLLNVASEDTQGVGFEGEGVVVPVVVPSADVAGLLSDYDPDDQYSPAAADARDLARVLLDALKKHADS